MKKVLLLFLLLPLNAASLSDWQQTAAEAESHKVRQTAEKQTFKQIKAEVKAGFEDSLVDLADLYYDGIGTKKNYKKAYKYYKNWLYYGEYEYTDYEIELLKLFGAALSEGIGLRNLLCACET